MLAEMERQPPTAMRVLVADDDARVRSALRLVLEQMPGLTLGGEVGAARDLAPRVARSRPNVLVLDWDQPGVDGAAFLSTLRAASPHLVIVALASRPDARPDALAAGADHFVAKSDPPQALLDCLHAVAASGAALASAA